MSLLQKLSSLLLPDPPLDEAIRQAIDHAVEVVDPALRVVGGLERALAPAVESALTYCAGLVASLPAPVDVNQRAFATDPLVHAYFSSSDDIGSMLGRSQAVREFLDDGGHAFTTECYGMLGMRRNLKTVLGMALHGDVLQPESPRQLLYFSDHTLRELTLSEEETRGRLKIAAFDSLVQSFSENLHQQRQARDELRMTMESERGGGRGGLVPDEKDWRLTTLVTQYEAATAALAPERIAQGLAQWLAAPAERLYLQECSVAVDSLGVVAPEGDEPAGYTRIHCPELVGRDRRRWIVTLVRLSCPEARDAVADQIRKEAATRSLLI